VAEGKKFKLMKQSKIFIFPSYHEGFAQVICEAMACELPVVAYDLPGYKEWYGNDITYVKKKDLNSLLNVTLTLLEDDTFRREIGKKAKKRVKQYDWNKLARKEIYIITQKIFNS
jgi:glycosyltransferase involved in cell wall biosynthesis